MQRGRKLLGTVLALACALPALPASATGVPISGFYPLAGISLTDKYSTTKRRHHVLSAETTRTSARHSATAARPTSMSP